MIKLVFLKDLFAFIKATWLRMGMHRIYKLLVTLWISNIQFCTWTLDKVLGDLLHQEDMENRNMYVAEELWMEDDTGFWTD